MSQFVPVLIEMMRNPPDPNEPLPLSNRLSTAIGVSIPFLVRWLLYTSMSRMNLTDIDAQSYCGRSSTFYQSESTPPTRLG